MAKAVPVTATDIAKVIYWRKKPEDIINEQGKKNLLLMMSHKIAFHAIY
jgi:hypothetical protein